MINGSSNRKFWSNFLPTGQMRIPIRWDFQKNFPGPSSNKNSWVSESRDTIFMKKFHQKSFRQIELRLDVFGCQCDESIIRCSTDLENSSFDHFCSIIPHFSPFWYHLDLYHTSFTQNYTLLDHPRHVIYQILKYTWKTVGGSMYIGHGNSKIGKIRCKHRGSET